MNQKKRILLTGAAVLLAAALLTGGITYARTVAGTVQNFGTGAVNIELESSGGEAGEDFEVMPGQNVKLAMDVCNKAAPCYVRAKLEFSEYADILNGRVYGIPKDWIYNRHDGFWYWTKTVEETESIPFFKGFTLPGDFPEDGKDRFILTVKAEALQERNVEPAFGSDDPWNGVPAEYNADRTFSENTISGEKHLQVVYEGTADRLIADPEDFFCNLPALMPGDSYSQEIELKNDSKSASDLYFYTLADGDALAGKLLLTIRTFIGGEEKTIYEGSLASESLDGAGREVCLGRLKAGEKGQMTFTLDVPADLKNRDALQKGRVKWIFSTDRIEEKKESRSFAASSGIHTGDGVSSDHWFMLLTACGASLITILHIRRKTGGTDRP